jgi:hypothetical protein
MSSKKVLVKVPEALLKLWRSMYQRGDVEEIKKAAEKKAGRTFTTETIRVLIRKGEARNVYVYEATIEYYERKQDKMLQLLKRFEHNVSKGFPTFDDNINSIGTEESHSDMEKASLNFEAEAEADA